MSGGGARGGAHIGVIKALEELRVPIDAIAGTSIGAIVGGFYVSGMTVQDMQNLVESLEWEDAFLNVTPRKLKSFRRKRDDYTFLVNQKPGLNGGQFQLPAGLVQGQVFDMVISRETLRASQVKSFDDLAVPFRAVATDLATGRPVVLEAGNLALSLRASMSIPAALTPVEIDGRLLVDGGVSLNLPIEVAQQMGADVIIAVDVSSPLQTRETLKSVVDVTTQLTNLLGRASLDEQLKKLKPNDVLIVPSFAPDFSSINFTRMHEAIETGYNAVMDHRVELSRFALDEDQYAAYRQNTRDPRMRELPKIDFIKIKNNSAIADSVIEQRLKDIELGKQLDVDRIERAVNKVYGLEYYQNVRYGFTTQDGDTGLQVELDKRSWGPNYLQLGMQYSSGGNVRRAVRACGERSEHRDQSGRRRVARDVRGRGRAAARARSLSAVRLEGTLFLCAVAELPVDDHQRVARRSAHHRGREPRGRSRVRHRARNAELGRISLRPSPRYG